MGFRDFLKRSFGLSSEGQSGKEINSRVSLNGHQPAEANGQDLSAEDEDKVRKEIPKEIFVEDRDPRKIYDKTTSPELEELYDYIGQDFESIGRHDAKKDEGIAERRKKVFKQDLLSILKEALIAEKKKIVRINDCLKKAERQGLISSKDSMSNDKQGLEERIEQLKEEMEKIENESSEYLMRVYAHYDFGFIQGVAEGIQNKRILVLGKEYYDE